jgi:hypothetical protein
MKSLWDEPWHDETSLSASILGSRMDSPNAHDDRSLVPLDNSIGTAIHDIHTVHSSLAQQQWITLTVS